MKKILILGGAGMLGPYVIAALDQNYDLRVTDIRPLDMAFRGEFRQVDVAAYDQVLDAAAGMDAIINLSVLRQDRQLAFDVSTLGCYNMMRAAVAHNIQRVINTGPHFTVAGATYEAFDFNLSTDMPPQPGTAMTRSPLRTLVTPSPIASTTPATSPPGEKGRVGLNWYLSSMIRVSGKLTPMARTSITTSPFIGRGSMTSSTTRVSGPPEALDRTARMGVSPLEFRRRRDERPGSSQ